MKDEVKQEELEATFPTINDILPINIGDYNPGDYSPEVSSADIQNYITELRKESDLKQHYY